MLKWIKKIWFRIKYPWKKVDMIVTDKGIKYRITGYSRGGGIIMKSKKQDPQSQ